MTYNSKRALIFWDYDQQTIDRRTFKNKSEMIASMTYFRECYDALNKEVNIEVLKNEVPPVDGAMIANSLAPVENKFIT